MIILGNNSVVLTTRQIPVYQPPVLISSPTSQSGNPAFTGHQVGDLLVAIAANSNAHSGAAPVATGGWTVWDSLFESTNRSISLVYKIATTTSETISWDIANGVRQNHVFRNAAIDNRILITAASSTTLDWPELTPIEPDSIVCTYVMSRNSQTAVTAVELGGSYTNTATRNAVPAGLAQTSSPNLVSTFNPANGTFDTISSGHMVAVFSVKGVTS